MNAYRLGCLTAWFSVVWLLFMTWVGHKGMRCHLCPACGISRASSTGLTWEKRYNFAYGGMHVPVVWHCFQPSAHVNVSLVFIARHAAGCCNVLWTMQHSKSAGHARVLPCCHRHAGITEAGASAVAEWHQSVEQTAMQATF
ncbi:hypothetical protein V8C86DRAFT_379636 [Haematococcus lacustris]